MLHLRKQPPDIGEVSGGKIFAVTWAWGFDADGWEDSGVALHEFEVASVVDGAIGEAAADGGAQSGEEGIFEVQVSCSVPQRLDGFFEIGHGLESDHVAIVEEDAEVRRTHCVHEGGGRFGEIVAKALMGFHGQPNAQRFDTRKDIFKPGDLRSEYFLGLQM